MRLKSIIGGLRAVLEPDYRKYQAIFANLDQVAESQSNHVNREAYDVWKQKLGKRPAQMIDALLERGELTRIQLATITGQSPNSGSYANNLSALNRVELIEKNGDKMRLRQL